MTCGKKSWHPISPTSRNPRENVISLASEEQAKTHLPKGHTAREETTAPKTSCPAVPPATALPSGSSAAPSQSCSKSMHASE
ncbi:uncharacterized protein MONOS_510 [Monocercomonoides exilis]|uniref:uncharacterized protein n=1 Tax=Monocercomonoides exilis TaxID=2049356 RepID=UPI003559ACD9|nr:hypothetical protein MONOS_510 [Monocercomonoides exilis]|eukprot:MONOS_510.1-p1 / transcript=MONOS_510.1 / gene=MONOS_510 / organism=Monocercomonoides_exilis_PA203 / gene_product=unspecified product / transcript_product=unspecified product / location=Mono_scaffold00008:105032-105277(-) / protein_length=82 / sequence_SO=supercontig / SO=protein_coding / is_pseudo=false